MKPTDDTFIVQLTVEQLVDILKQEFPLLTLTKADLQPPKKEEKKKDEKEPFMGRKLYGIKGIEDFFNVSHKTAFTWKETWLKPAVKQRGRKIVIDADLALKLFEKNEKKEQLKRGRKRGK